MNCIYCGAYTNSEQGICINCAQNPKVTVLATEERQNFQGITIEQSNGESSNDHSQTKNPSPHVYVRQFSFGLTKGSLLIKLLIGAVFLMLVLVALPIVLVALSFFAIIWIFIRLAAR